MRNLKRALSLALASVMVLGLMVVGSGASYADVTSEENQEAIEVLQAVGVMVGDDNGNFNPDRNVTRNEMAVVMSNLLDLKVEDFNAADIPFTDVPSWAVPYVAACYADGITGGISATTYSGSSTVTAAQAALMMMKALGYFQYQGDFEQDWTLATIKQGSEIGIFDGITVDRTSPLTRNDVAQMALNALKSNMVLFTGDLGLVINGVEIGYRAEYTARTSANSKYNRIDVGTTDIASNNQYYVQLGEELYNGDLELNNDAADVFGRPARAWEYNGKEIGTYVNESLMVAEYTAKVTGDTLYDLLTRNTVINYDVDVVIDGEYEAPTGANAGQWFTKNAINRNNDATVGGTGNGVLTQVFVDNEADEIVISIINTYLAIANKDYDSRKDEVSFDVYGAAKTGTVYYKSASDTSLGMKVSGEDFSIENIAEDDKMLVSIADGEIQTLAAADDISGTEIQSFETSDNLNAGGVVSLVEIDGTEYDFADAASYDLEVMEYYTGPGHTNLKDTTYNVYFDTYGYVIGIEETEKINNYLFITGIDLNGSNRGARTADATAIFMDGTIDGNAKIDYADSDFTGVTMSTDGNSMVNRWFTYTEDKDGVYTVEIVNSTTAPSKNGEKIAQYQDTYDPNDGEINDKHIYLNGGLAGFSNVYGTDDTVYLTVELDELDVSGPHYGIISDVSSVATGISNVDLTIWNAAKALADADANDTTATISGAGNACANGAYVLYNWEGDIIAAVVVGEDAGATKNLVYAHTDVSYRERYNSSTGEYTWNRYVISDGQEVSLTEVGDGLSKLDTMKPDHWYQVKYNADGNVIDVIPVTGTAPTGALTNGEDFENAFMDLASTVQTGEDTVLYWTMNSADEISHSNLKLIGRSLFLDTTSTRGFRVAEDVNVVLQQYNNNTSKTYFETGVNALESIVNELNERHEDMPSTHTYAVSAIIERGVASSVIINDHSKDCDPYSTPDWGTSDGKVQFVSTDAANAFNAPRWYSEDASAVLSNADIQKMLIDAGAEQVTKGAGNNWSFTYDDVSYVNTSVNPVRAYKYTFDADPYTLNKDVYYVVTGDVLWSVTAYGDTANWNPSYSLTDATGTVVVTKDGVSADGKTLNMHITVGTVNADKDITLTLTP